MTETGVTQLLLDWSSGDKSALNRLMPLVYDEWRNRAQFFAVAARMIRRILVDHARERSAAKRGGGAKKLALDETIATPAMKDVDLVALDDALVAMAELDPQQTEVVELRFFAGLTIEETAEALGISPATVNRDWVTAKA